MLAYTLSVKNAHEKTIHYVVIKSVNGTRKAISVTEKNYHELKNMENETQKPELDSSESTQVDNTTDNLGGH